MRKFNVAVVGATGAVGEELFRVLEEVNFPINKLIPLASARSAGSKIEYMNKEITVLELTETVFEENDVEIAFFSAGGSVSEKFAKFAVEAGAVVIDNTSHFRMDPKVPLVVPEVNPEDIKLWKETGIIANPNCSTIQMVQSLKPLDELYGIRRVDVSTYQAVSGAGKTGMEELVKQMQDFFAFRLDETEIKAFPYQIALNVIPQIDVAKDNGFTKEEMKMVLETQKIMHKEIQVAATCVRVPVLRSHSESITVTFEDNIDVDVEEVRNALINFENVKVIDDLPNKKYPMPIISTDTDFTYVGRIRKDVYAQNIVHYFNVADQVRVGAATNAVRIGLKWIELESDI
ncbi:aspartate-semialdehyde dehydrogenase [Aliarcobacter butzleri]|uniref:Aspartate-semialdehyde dehydrogenase n=1 Tax=Aliarcobacter butzleri L351 TaxID=1447259 RepID=A0A837J7H0_9BACT|nr:aspartate-semialdehyde dehydrogenase [Aliarcobacter butzleri]KLE02102.1 aspartate-semialdehyde dehydrogenase [Aliarcobacter butzleri L351]KLE13705.1 aspartate-semialdehyde dehydrogenase [Aliarcobacter butzleri L350]MCG3658257.1 aspartate-semialdehyde dehydrogenase [Aliarcobacter butzleri]MDN5048387.1 aspartate-semialdehyde dehydrogenase [Aliarcobacter butzleri]MDN5060074.1 aspartate-semialdehyde dehydrogenase [Aliarcobacter butzleri]